ncbi:GNAT family N-acetyltransferase [Kalamiella sp. sgz302252]|uniref:GNAT family N-acetyltransferase n=1 Tax=Pantoea sp. sgz302252 TaxID=3341827 RepID=UPI0036D26927
MKDNSVKITVRLANSEDIAEVKQLLERHHVKNLAAEQRANGFVTTDMTEQQLKNLSDEESGVVVAYDEEKQKMVGLLLGASWQFLKPWPMFDYMANILQNYQFRNESISAVSSYQYGPICIDAAYRSQGIGEKLLAFQRKVFAKKFGQTVTFVNVLNPRSYAFHRRNQFEDVGLFEFNNNKYHMLAMNTKD